MKLDAEIDRLYGLPLDEFVDERGQLAKQLRSDGDREAAERVKALRKPTVGAWALNLVVRLRPGERDKLLKAGEALRKAHEALLSGGDPAALREAMTTERALAAALADAAEAVATEAGKGGPALKERVRGTLHAAAVDEEARDELATGRVVRERDAVGLGPFGAAAAAPAAPRKGDAATTKRGSTSRATGGTKGARGSAARAGEKQGSDADRRRAEREQAKQEREQAKQERAERSRAKKEQAERVVVAERSLAAAHSALAKADAAHDRAATDLDAAQRVLKAAQAAEREARAAKRERAKEVTKRERELDKLRGAGP